MSAFDEDEYTPGYRLDSAIVLRDLHLLLCVFLSIETIRHSYQGDRDPIESLHERFGETELQQLLISTAIMNRTHMDHMRNLRGSPDELSFKPLEETCGALRQPENVPEVALTLREACNKIVHARKIELELERHPRLHLSGRNGPVRWSAMIEVVRYVRASIKNFEDALA
jgi:hypothetical protein